MLGLGGLGLEIVDRLVGRPVVAEMLEEFIGDRLEHRGALGAEPFQRERFVHGFNHRIETERLAGPLSVHAGAHIRVRRSRGRDACRSIELVSERVTQAGVVVDEVVEGESVRIAQLLSFGELVEIHLERSFVAIQ